MKKSLWKSKSVVMTLTITYVVVLLLPILANLVVIFQSVHIMDKEADRRQTEMLTNVARSMDKTFSEISYLATQIALDEEVISLSYLNRDTARSYNDRVKQVMEKMRMISQSADYLDGFYIYLSQPEICITATSFYEKEKAFKILHPYYDITQQKWESLMGRGGESMFYEPVPMKQGGTSIAYIQNIPVLDSQVSMGKVVILVNEATLRRLLPEETADSKFMIADQYGNVFCAPAGLDKEKWPKAETAQSGREQTCRMAGETYVQRAQHSADEKFQYILLGKKVSISPESLVVVATTIAITTVVLTAGGFIIIYSIRRNRTAIERVISAVSQKIGVSADRDKDTDEFSLIQSMVDSATFLGRQEADELQRQKAALRQDFLLRLLKGKVADNVLQESLEPLDLQLAGDQFAVEVFYIQSCEAFFSDEKELSEQRKADILTFILQNVTSELAGDNPAYLVEADDLRVLVVNLKQASPPEEARQVLERIAGVTLKTLAEELEIDVVCAASGLHTGLDTLPVAYREALEILEYKLLTQRYDPMNVQDISFDKSSFDYPFDVEQKLMNAIKRGQAEDAEKIVLDLLRNNIERAPLPASMAKLFIHDILSTIVKTLDGNRSVEEMSELELFGSILNTNDMASIKKNLLQLIELICGQFVPEQTDSRSKVASSVNEYIEAHYMDKDLSVSNIAEQLYFSTAYLSRAYKEQTGEGILVMINKTRIAKAKELLDATNLSVDKIADQVGFNSSTVFIRVFRKYIGMTPGKYKEL